MLTELICRIALAIAVVSIVIWGLNRCFGSVDKWPDEDNWTDGQGRDLW